MTACKCNAGLMISGVAITNLDSIARKWSPLSFTKDRNPPKFAQLWAAATAMYNRSTAGRVFCTDHRDFPILHMGQAIIFARPLRIRGEALRLPKKKPTFLYLVVHAPVSTAEKWAATSGQDAF